MPFLDSQFVGLLRCPASKSPLREISLEQLHTLGFKPEQCLSWDAGLLRADGGGVYPLRGGIPILLAEELVPLGDAMRAPTNPAPQGPTA